MKTRPTCPTLLALMTALLCAAQVCAAAPRAADPGGQVDSSWVLRILARPAPMRTSFVEFRDSRLLKSPLRLSGEYQRPDDDTLVREVRAPYVETTTIHDGEATIARAGQAPRTFSLARIPELGSLQTSFGALLSGDRKRLQQQYTIETTGTHGQWTMTLKPKQALLADKLRDIRLYGRGSELRCIESRPVKGDVQRTLLASAARDAGDVDDAAALTALCRGQTQ